MKWLWRIFILLLFSVVVPAMAQDNKTSGKEEKKNEIESARIKRKKAKAQWKEKRKQERIERKSVRRHEKRLQTKETRKRMRKNRQKANRVNQNKKEFFLIRLFKPKPRTGGW